MNVSGTSITRMSFRVNPKGPAPARVTFGLDVEGPAPVAGVVRVWRANYATALGRLFGPAPPPEVADLVEVASLPPAVPEEGARPDGAALAELGNLTLFDVWAECAVAAVLPHVAAAADVDAVLDLAERAADAQTRRSPGVTAEAWAAFTSYRAARRRRSLRERPEGKRGAAGTVPRSLRRTTAWVAETAARRAGSPGTA